MGAASGIITLIGVYLAQSNPRIGYSILLFVSSTLSVMFLMRFLKTYKMMPSGMLLAMSVVAFIISISYFLKK